MSDYERGFQAGYLAGWREGTGSPVTDMTHTIDMKVRNKPKRKVPQKGKAKVLTSMTKPIWDKYKKGNGKKTYVTIRAQVSRSQAYKKKVKGMK